MVHLRVTADWNDGNLWRKRFEKSSFGFARKFSRTFLYLGCVRQRWQLSNRFRINILVSQLDEDVPPSLSLTTSPFLSVSFSLSLGMYTCIYQSIAIYLSVSSNVWAAGLPDGIFSYQKSQFGYFWSTLDWKMLVNLKTIWNTLRQFGVIYVYSVYCVVVWYIFPFWYSKSGNPV
jgi:hypothetical protein